MSLLKKKAPTIERASFNKNGSETSKKEEEMDMCIRSANCKTPHIWQAMSPRADTVIVFQAVFVQVPSPQKKTRKQKPYKNPPVLPKKQESPLENPANTGIPTSPQNKYTKIVIIPFLHFKR